MQDPETERCSEKRVEVAKLLLESVSVEEQLSSLDNVGSHLLRVSERNDLRSRFEFDDGVQVRSGKLMEEARCEAKGA